MSYFNYDGAKVFYEEFGSDNVELLLLLHGNTVSSKFFTPVIPKLSERYHVITIDFIGCGKSERIEKWPADLWFDWANQVAALIKQLGYTGVNVIGCSGGAIAAINLALENPELINAVVADSFEGLNANPEITEQIRMGRNLAKENEGFCSMSRMMHGEDWENVLDADTDAVVNHALNVRSFCHKSLNDLKVRLLLTGSSEDEMFPENHFSRLFEEMCKTTELAESHLFEHGGHPAMISNMDEFISICDEFFAR
ncbi:alpha/beta hydrolase [Bacillus sp. AGMB 02131]|uniref:Alpha/beta hydrolase n=1 Tax=Peribacillus faecalis TaxID=2772559 RepID=A0A927CYQ3_9BACI|nr:alpha/beta hydrolase [Peribacillus faecalis]MBD3109122.1 alpha/beta hydrolase [Peribacillus faecalis]